MSAAKRINKECTLLNSSNQFLPYPVDGLIEDAEFDIQGNIIWATFRAKQKNWLDDAGQVYGCPVIVKCVVTTDAKN